MDSEFIDHLDAQRHTRPHPQCCTGNCEQGRSCTAPRQINWGAIIVYGSCAALWVATAGVQTGWMKAPGIPAKGGA